MIWGGVIGLLLTNFKGKKKSEEEKWITVFQKPQIIISIRQLK
jgi:hypothetical protein